MTLTLKAIPVPNPRWAADQLPIGPVTIALNAFPRRIAKQLPVRSGLTRAEYDRVTWLGEIAWDAIERGDRGGHLIEIDGQHFLLQRGAILDQYVPIVPRIFLC